MPHKNQRSNSRLGSQVRGRGLHCRASCACSQHHGSVTGACMPSPCNLGLSRLLSYIAKMMVRHDMLCPSISVLLRCCEISQRDLAPAPASRDALARAQRRLSSNTGTIASSAYAQEAVRNGQSYLIAAPINHLTTLPPL